MVSNLYQPDPPDAFGAPGESTANPSAVPAPPRRRLHDADDSDTGNGVGDENRHAPREGRTQEDKPAEKTAQEKPANDQNQTEEKPAAKQGEEKPKGPPPVPLYKRRWFWPVIIVLSIIVVVGGIIWFLYAWTYESTDDAYTDGHVVEISPQVSGRTLHVLVNDNDDVTEGQTLVEIDPSDYQAAVNQQEANLKVAQAEADRANAILSRYNRIRDSSAVSPQDYDEIVAAARKANAQVTAGEAQVATSRLQLQYTKIVAPFSGRIARKNIEPGAYVTPGQAMMAVVDPHVWVEANFKETQLKVIKPGDKVRIKVDAFPGLVLHGHVDSVQPGSGATFSLLPPENATGNFVKVVQRVPVKIVFDDYVPDATRRLGVGLSVRPRVTVR